METEKRSLRAEVKALEDRVDALVAEIAALRNELSPVEKPRPSETFSLWNNRVNAGTQ